MSLAKMTPSIGSRCARPDRNGTIAKLDPRTFPSMGRSPKVLRALGVAIWLLAAVALVAPPAAHAQPQPNGEPLACGQEITRTDENGTFHLRFQCLPTQGLLNWGYTFNPQWRTMAIGPVTETGMSYWRDGVEMDRNSNHDGLPIDFFFHGTLPAVSVGNEVAYQDFFTFKADFGPTTGTARVSIAGSVILTP